MTTFENNFLRRLFGPKREKIMKKLKKRMNDQIEDESVEHVARMGEMRNSYEVLVGKPRRKTRLEETQGQTEG